MRENRHSSVSLGRRHRTDERRYLRSGCTNSYLHTNDDKVITISTRLACYDGVVVSVEVWTIDGLVEATGSLMRWLVVKRLFLESNGMGWNLIKKSFQWQRYSEGTSAVLLNHQYFILYKELFLSIMVPFPCSNHDSLELHQIEITNKNELSRWPILQMRNYNRKLKLFSLWATAAGTFATDSSCISVCSRGTILSNHRPTSTTNDLLLLLLSRTNPLDLPEVLAGTWNSIYT